MFVLGIETSCDETAISIYNSQKGIIINKLFSQINIHNKFGGIIPEIASQNHVKKIIPLLNKVFKSINFNIKKIDLIAYTAGPGLPNSLLIGTTLAKCISFLFKKPSIPINHLEAHILSIMLSKKKPKFPFICLITSGINTLLYIVENYEKYKIIGKSLDNSAGETFDKISKILKLNLPGGKNISKLAIHANKNLNFPEPLIKKQNLNFSFSGLKTHIFYFIKNKKLTFQTKANIAYSLEKSITNILIKKTILASNKFNIKNISIVGGVSLNKKLRKKMINKCKLLNKNIFFPKKKYCTDNAAMIAYTGFIKHKLKNFDLKIKIKPTWNINEIF